MLALCVAGVVCRRAVCCRLVLLYVDSCCVGVYLLRVCFVVCCLWCNDLRGCSLLVLCCGVALVLFVLLVLC